MYDKIYVLRPFFEDTARSYHIREAARLLGMNAMTARKYLQQLAQEGLLAPAEKNVVHRYHANTANPLFYEYKRFHNMTQIHTCGIIPLLKEHFPTSLIILHGDYAQGTDTPHTPAEFFILTDKRLVPALTHCETSLGRPIQLTLLNETQFRQHIGTNPSFANKITMGRAIQGKYLPFREDI